VVAEVIGQRLGAGLVVGIAGYFAAMTPATDSFMTIPQRDEARSFVAPTPVDFSSDGRFVAFDSYARLVPADEDNRRDVYVLNRSNGRVTLESGMLESWADSSHPRLSGDGRYLVFEAEWLAEGPLLPRTVIVLCDRSAGTSTVLRAVDRNLPNRSSYAPDISSDGRFVVFSSTATDLVPGPDANDHSEDVYALDVQTAVVRRISVDSTGAQASVGASFSPSVSADGRWIAFVSTAPLGSAAARGSQASRPNLRQVYARDMVLGTTTPVSLAGDQASADGGSARPVISGDGRYVAFVSDATNLVSNDRNRAADIFLHDRHTGSTRLISRAADGGSANGDSRNPALSVDGRFVAFQSDASNLGCTGRCPPTSEDINLLWDVFVWDRQRNAIVRASEDELGRWMEPSIGPALDAKGLTVAFSSRHPIDGSDRVNDFDLFIRAVPDSGRQRASR